MDLKSNNGEDNDLSEPSSPLKSMSITTDTLSLRQSHIGNNFPNSYVMVNEYQKSIGVSNDRHIQEFVPYPPDIISTTVERNSATNWGTNWGFQSNRTYNQINHNLKLNKTKVKRIISQESFTTYDNSQECNDFDKQSIISVQSCCSGIDSNDSSFGNITGIDSELLKEDKSTETENREMVNEYIQVSINDDSTGPLFELKRMNANMKGKVEQLDYIVEEMVKERSHLQMKMHSLDKELKVKNENIEELNAHRDRYLLESEELKSGIGKWESIVGEYQEVVEAKTIEIQAYNEDMVKMSADNENLKINCEHFKIDLDSKENTIKELNQRVAQITGELDSLIQNKVSLEVEIKRIKGEVESISQQKEWFELELNKLQIRLNESHHKYVTEQEKAINARNDCEKVQALNAVLKQQLVEVRHKAVKEKELLMRHLEGIGADLVQKEAEHQLMSPKKEDKLTFKMSDKLSAGFEQKLSIKDLRIESLVKEVKQSTELNQKMVKEQELIINDLNSIKRQSNDKDYELNTLKSYNSDLEFKIRGLNIDLKRQRELNEMLRKDKKESETKLASLISDNKTLENATKQLKEIIERHERSLKQLQSNLIAKETKLDLLEKEKSKFSNTITMKEQEIAHLIECSNSISNDSNDVNVFDLKVRNNELEKVMNAMNSEMRTTQIKFEEQRNKLLKECSQLQSMLIEEKNKSESFRDKTRVDENKSEELKRKLTLAENKSTELQTEINLLKANSNVSEFNSRVNTNSEIIQIKDEKIRSLESNVKLLTKKYREVVQSKKEMESKLENLVKKSVEVSQSSAFTQTEDIAKENNNCEQIIANEELIQEMERLRETIHSKDIIIDENQKIILKLEHEKGKLSSAGENSMNEHIMSLEVLVTSKSEEIADLNEKLREWNKNNKELEIKLNKKLNEAENDLKKEKAIVKDLRHSIFAEKRENSYSKKDINELKKALTESNAIADKRKQELINIENEMKAQKGLISSLNNDIEKINNELMFVREENSKLKIKIEDSFNKNEPQMLEQLKNLSLNLMEKNQEIEGIKSNSISIKERYETEIQCLKQQIDSYRSDSETFTTELNELRKEKFGLQSRLAELRVVLKNSHEQNQKLREQLKNCKVVVSQEFAFNEELVTKLLDQSYENSKENKPLVNLQACVESLKLEMELLQKQISDH